MIKFLYPSLKKEKTSADTISTRTVISCYEVLKDDKVEKGEEKTKLYVNFKDLYDMAIKHKETNNIPSEKEIFGASASRITYHKKEQRYPRLLNNN